MRDQRGQGGIPPGLKRSLFLKNARPTALHRTQKIPKTIAPVWARRRGCVRGRARIRKGGSYGETIKTSGTLEK